MPSDVSTCPECGTDLPPSFLSCPGCRRLVHADRLKELSRQAASAEMEKRLPDAMSAWREAIEYLPPDSQQYRTVVQKIDQMSRQVDGLNPSPKASPSFDEADKPFWQKLLPKAGLLGLLILVFSKFKFLAMGLAKLKTVLTMALSFGAYWGLWGWKFALGFVLSIYVHEIGHVAALHHYGVKATAPMFIPGVGAFVRLKQTLVNPREDARVGLAGPIWGFGAVLASYALYHATDNLVFAAIAKFGAWINLLNLIPIWQLDGGRGFQSLAGWQRWVAVLVIGGMWWITKEGLLILLLILAVFQALKKEAPTEPDHVGLTQYVFLVVLLSFMCTIPVPIATPKG